MYQPVPAKKLPEDDLLYQLIAEEGLGPSEVVAWLREHKGIEVTPSSVSMWRRRAGLPAQAPKRSPWKYASGTNHSHTVEAQAVRAYYRREAGLPNDPERARMLESMEERLRRSGTVLHYNPDPELGPVGWYYVPPEPGIDLGIIREPDRVPRPPQWQQHVKPEAG